MTNHLLLIRNRLANVTLSRAKTFCYFILICFFLAFKVIQLVPSVSRAVEVLPSLRLVSEDSLLPIVHRESPYSEMASLSRLTIKAISLTLWLTLPSVLTFLQSAEPGEGLHLDLTQSITSNASISNCLLHNTMISYAWKRFWNPEIGKSLISLLWG